MAIARALVTDPTLIVADEPTGDLDRHTAEEVLDLLDQLQRDLGKTIIMVTHDPKAAARAGRMVHLEKGVLVDEEVKDSVNVNNLAEHLPNAKRTTIHYVSAPLTSRMLSTSTTHITMVGLVVAIAVPSVCCARLLTLGMLAWKVPPVFDS